MRNLNISPIVQAISICVGLAFVTPSNAQLPRIVVDGITAPQVFSDLTEAILAAPQNSNITLSGGSFYVPGGFALDKPLHFVGAGIHTDSTNATGATIFTTDASSIFALTSGASGSSFTGIWFNTAGNITFSLGTGQGDQNVTGVDFLRCMFQNQVRLGVVEPAASSSAFTECIFHGALVGNSGVCVVNRCIFDYSPGTGGMIVTFRPGGLSLLNSIILGGKLDACSYATVSNCIFTRATAPIWQCDTTTVTNCIFASGQIFLNMTGGIEYDNFTGIPPGAIFANEMDDKYQFTDNVHLTGNSVGIGAGSDGNDIGIYGSSSPYKPGGVPHVPHIRKVDIARGTNANGNLPASVRVAAQPN